MMLSPKKAAEFKAYLRDCSEAQLLDVLKKERIAGRSDCEVLAQYEYMNRLKAGKLKPVSK